MVATSPPLEMETWNGTSYGFYSYPQKSLDQAVKDFAFRPFGKDFRQLFYPFPVLFELIDVFEYIRIDPECRIRLLGTFDEILEVKDLAR